MAGIIKNLVLGRERQDRELIDNILDCVIYIDKDRIIQKVNLETLNLLGYREEELLGKRFDFMLGSYFYSRWEDFCKVLLGGSVKNYDAVLKRKNGVEIPVKMNITQFKDNSGEITGWFITAKDMTWTRKIIRELSNSRKELQRTIKELKESREELVRSEKLSFAGRMAASVAHEIRNPLNIIGMAVQQLHNELKEKDPRRDYTEVVMRHIDRVSKLITEFVNAARPPKLKMQWRDINAIVDDVLKFTGPKFKGKKFKIIKKLDMDLPKIMLDEEHMSQAFINLILNAFDALPKRGEKIWVITKRDNFFVYVNIRNSGRPIPKKDIIRIFDPFFSTKKTGIGLGLSIAYSIIGSHKGSISVESNKKVGTIFSIRLPYRQTDRQTEYLSEYRSTYAAF